MVDQGDTAAEWLTAFLETPARLVAMSADYRRPVHPQLPREFDGRLTFADASPLLVVGSESLADLNARLETPLPMNRFRPNIVIDGCPPYAEGGWDRILVGDLVLERLAPCGRCAITTTDQASAERGKEPLTTLATYRRDPDFGVIFGSYYGHTTIGRLAVGDAVTVG